jgi:Response regulator containing a CheY-like receiver domain and an HTH DNA-binding domain
VFTDTNFASIADLPGMVAVARDTELRLRWCDTAYAALFGRDPASMAGQLPHSQEHSAERAEHRVIAHAREERVTQLWRGRRCLARLSPIRDHAGSVVGVLSLIACGTAADADPSSRLVEASDLADLDVLSPRELEIFYWLGRGDAGPDIARRLFRSSKTVERHTESVFHKLRLRRRVDVAILAGERGITRFQPDEWSKILAARSYRRASPGSCPRDDDDDRE